MPKGSRYEREVCTDLSYWWSDGERDDIFWRTAGSGARATQRNRVGKTTPGQHGDVAAIDPDGRAFTAVVTVSLKRGWSRYTLHDLLDRPAWARMPEWEKWIMEAELDAQAAGTPYWMIIAKRDRREPLLVAPSALLDQIPLLVARCRIAGKSVVLYNDFLDIARPSQFRKLK
jgi:hypothetical protein